MCCGQTARWAPGPQPQRSQMLICIEFSNKETCGREGEREKEGGLLRGKPSGRMIQPPSPVTRGRLRGARPRGRRGRGSGCCGSQARVLQSICERRAGPARADTSSTSAPMQLGEGRRGRGGSPAPALAPSRRSRRLLRKSQRLLSPRPGKVPRSQLPSCSPLAACKEDAEPGG